MKKLIIIINIFLLPVSVVRGNFCQFTNDSISPGYALSITYVYFNVNIKQGTTVLLSWQVIQEKNEYYFQIQRSADGINWTAIGNVMQNISGCYSFNDVHPCNATNFYRLRQAGPDGQFYLSSVRIIHLPYKISLLLWPNPVNDVLNIQITEAPATVIIFDAVGRQVGSAKLYQPATGIPVQQLPPATYWAHIYAAGKIVTATFIKR